MSKEEIIGRKVIIEYRTDEGKYCIKDKLISQDEWGYIIKGKLKYFWRDHNMWVDMDKKLPRTYHIERSQVTKMEIE